MTGTFEQQRQTMVERQLAARGITDTRVLDAMARVRREHFLEPAFHPQAYDDSPLPLAPDATISQPYMVALMAQCLRLRGGETVLEIGGGCGYAAAVYAQLARHVVSVELQPALAARGADNLRRAGVTNAVMMCGDGTRGYAAQAPYDAISVAAAAREVPPALLDQLGSGGRLVIPVGPGDEQELLLIERTGSTLTRTCAGLCRFVPLRG